MVSSAQAPSALFPKVAAAVFSGIALAVRTGIFSAEAGAGSAIAVNFVAVAEAAPAARALRVVAAPAVVFAGRIAGAFVFAAGWPS